MLDRIGAVLDPMRADEFAVAAARAHAAPPADAGGDDGGDDRDLSARCASGAGRACASQPIARRAVSPRCTMRRGVRRRPPSRRSSPRRQLLRVAADATRDPLAHVARAALRIRHTLTGRVLYRLAPKSLLDALKARLPR